jgi:putative holliday junction resolvase
VGEAGATRGLKPPGSKRSVKDSITEHPASSIEHATLVTDMRIMAVDFGTRRIGLAVSDPSATLARPLETVAGSADPRAAVAAVVRAIETFEAADEPITTIVVGLPKRLDGSANEQTPRATAFAAVLAARTGKEVVLQDERLTSHQADELLGERERDWRVRKRRLDAAAAAVILQEYLDARPA